MPALLNGLAPRWGVYDVRRIGWSVPAAKPVAFGWRGIPFGPVANVDMHVIFTALLDDLAAEAGYHVQPDRDDWAGVNRPVTGGTVPSFHAAMVAIDIDALENPYVKDGSWRAHTIPDRMTIIAARYGCEWGGDWTRPKDYMHVESHLTPADAKILADRIRALNKETEMPVTDDDANRIADVLLGKLINMKRLDPDGNAVPSHNVSLRAVLEYDDARAQGTDRAIARAAAKTDAKLDELAAKVGTPPAIDYRKLAAALIAELDPSAT